MDFLHEKIEIGLDTQCNQITIVVGTEAEDVQSVVVLNANFSSRAGGTPLHRVRSTPRIVTRRNSNASNSSTCTNSARLPPSNLPPPKCRSDLLRPTSPITHRSSLFDGERRGEREQPPRDSRERGMSTNSRIPYYRAPSNTSLGSRSSTDSSRMKPKYSSKHMMDPASTNLLPPMEEGKIYRFKNKRSKGKGFLGPSAFRNRSRVDAVVWVADV